MDYYVTGYFRKIYNKKHNEIGEPRIPIYHYSRWSGLSQEPHCNTGHYGVGDPKTQNP